MTRPDRLLALRSWLTNDLKLNNCTITPASGDASFRKYFRVADNENSFIVMDARPEKEDCKPFIKITHKLESAGLNVPHIHASDLSAGFLLLGDLGDVFYLSVLNQQTADQLYEDAFEALLKIQKIPADDLPEYDKELLYREMELFRNWFLEKHINITLNEEHNKVLDQIFDLLAHNALSQPQVFVHLDYHSRNLMNTQKHNPGILDYQDAVRGAVTYDLVSLLRDCYIAWPSERVSSWALAYRRRLISESVIPFVDDTTFLRWFDLMGVQRHLKAIGIFARLKHRDGKNNYISDIPRTLNYVKQISPQHQETIALHQLITELKVEEILHA